MLISDNHIYEFTSQETKEALVDYSNKIINDNMSYYDVEFEGIKVFI